MTEGFLAPSGDVLGDWGAWIIVRATVPILMATSILQMASGGVLEAFEDALVTEPALLVLVPVMIGTAGNLASIFCARLTTQLHLGGFEVSVRDPTLRSNGLAVVGLALVIFTLMGVGAWGIGSLLGGSLGVATLLVISLSSGLLLAVWVIVLGVSTVVVSYRLGYNPDDTTIPIVTNVCDVTGVFILFGAILLFV